MELYMDKSCTVLCLSGACNLMNMGVLLIVRQAERKLGHSLLIEFPWLCTHINISKTTAQKFLFHLVYFSTLTLADSGSMKQPF